MEFRFFPLRFSFVALDPVRFPAGGAANILRGSFGHLFRRLVCRADCSGPRACPSAVPCPYARLFEPSARGSFPSGLSNLPRAFVFRAAHLDGRTLERGERFHFDLNLFDLHFPAIGHFAHAFSQLASEGLGPRRGRVTLSGVSGRALHGPSAGQTLPGSAIDQLPEVRPAVLSLLPPPVAVSRLVIQFVTPTELKRGSGAAAWPEFDVLAARIRDRLSTLRQLYGDGPLPLDFRAFAARASAVRLVRSDLTHVANQRRSSRTGQVHPIGGFTGTVEYEGPLTEFVPFLDAAQYTGVGRQTVWGKGQIERLA